MKPCRRCWELGTTDCPHDMKYTDLKLNKEDLEGSRYPNLDTKRQVIDGAIIDKINEILKILDEHKEYMQFLKDNR